MSPTMAHTPSPIENQAYRSASPSRVDRHDYAIQKHRKQASTGGGRAWTEEEVLPDHIITNSLSADPFLGSISP
jgi:hypothetical protein